MIDQVTRAMMRDRHRFGASIVHLGLARGLQKLISPSVNGAARVEVVGATRSGGGAAAVAVDGQARHWGGVEVVGPAQRGAGDSGRRLPRRGRNVCDTDSASPLSRLALRDATEWP